MSGRQRIFIGKRRPSAIAGNNRPWYWICGGSHACSYGYPKDGTWESALIAAKAHAHGKHKVVI